MSDSPTVLAPRNAELPLYVSSRCSQGHEAAYRFCGACVAEGRTRPATEVTSLTRSFDALFEGAP